MLKGKKVFISGGNGVIGNELVLKLHKEGAILLVGDLKPRPKFWPKEILYRQGDLNYITERELDDFSPEYFFHLAATFERSTETYEFWEENFAHNVNLSHHLMTILKDSRSLKKVIFCSSYLIYNKELYNFADPQAQPSSLRESDHINPRNLTGAAKLSHEIELEFIQQYKKIQVINARIYRSYGKNSRDIISRWTRALLQGEKITVFNKENIFDYIYAGDVAEGLLRLSKTTFNGIVNLGTGKSRRIEEIVSIFEKHFPKLKKEEVGQKILFEASQANTSLLKEVTGWEPSHRLEDVIPEIIEFEKNVGYHEDKCDFNVLITSVAKKIGMVKAAKSAMDKIGNSGMLIGGDVNPEAIGKYFVDKFWKMPRTEDENLKEILSYCQTNNVSIIIPSRDGELLFWAKNKSALAEKGINVMVSDASVVESCVDKLKFFNECEKYALPAIETAADISKLKANKYVVKERFGAGAESIGLNLSRDEAVAHAKSLSDPIFQPFVPGKEYSADLYVSRAGVVKGVIVRQRNLVVDGESQVTTMVVNKKIEKSSADFAKAFGLYGHNILQVIEDENGDINIIECNSRFGGASTLSVSAGLDSFLWLFLESQGEDIAGYSFVRSNSNLKQIRYADNLVI